ncbi:MAG: hypothetical protein ACFCUQ_15945 [Kiloniellales bacterium]
MFSCPDAIADSLSRLGRLHLRLTLLRVLLPAQGSPQGSPQDARGRETVLEAVADVDDPSLIVEMASDGSLLVLAYGPRSASAEGDRLVAAELAIRLLGALSKRLDLELLAAAQVAVLHSWSDGLDPATASQHELACEPLVPLHTLLRLAA